MVIIYIYTPLIINQIKDIYIYIHTYIYIKYLHIYTPFIIYHQPLIIYIYIYTKSEPAQRDRLWIRGSPPARHPGARWSSLPSGRRSQGLLRGDARRRGFRSSEMLDAEAWCYPICHDSYTEMLNDFFCGFSPKFIGKHMVYIGFMTIRPSFLTLGFIVKINIDVEHPAWWPPGGFHRFPISIPIFS